eukprot:TRINITY_DN12915_c0_g2_i1.p1 TRINITY_DN12915_c0_g2~~TRINITY_DN12915_c0_g2_i1.p1  ORF type:complete len:676 (-),score=84.30 TRINITY_DN12915_c0_g2_i1:102-2129(-)
MSGERRISLQIREFPFTMMTWMFFLVTSLFIASAAAEIDAAQSCNLLQRGLPHASPLSSLDQAERRVGISNVPGVVKLQKSLPRENDCTLIVSLSTKSMHMLEGNVPHFHPYCDLIAGHYDLDADSFMKKPWYQKVVALAVEKPYFNKMELLEDLLVNHRDTLFSYKTALLLDDDIGLHLMKFSDFVNFGRDGPYDLVAPTIQGKHGWHTQDGQSIFPYPRCELLQTGVMQHQALLLKVGRLDDFMALLLEENRDNDRRIPCDWGFPRFVCLGLDNNTGTACAVADVFGAAVHTDKNSHDDLKSTVLLRVRDDPCDAIGDFVKHQNHFRYERLYDRNATFKCFTVSKSTGNRFLLRRDPSGENRFDTWSEGTAPVDHEVKALQKYCENGFRNDTYLSDLANPKRHLMEGGMYHVHIPKVAGMSFKKDASEISRSNVFSEETCLSDYPTSGKHLVLLREPRAHVLSQYYFCRDSDDAGPSHANFLMPKDISDWINFWIRFMSTGKSRQNFQYGPHTVHNSPWCSSRMPFGCYSPSNLQSQRLTCQHDTYDYSTYASEDAAIKQLDKLYFVGIQEAYQESLCLLYGMTHDDLPEWCDCTNKTAWSKATLTKETHGSVHHDFSELSQETRQGIDNLTAGDAALYKAGVKRFVHDVRELEKRLHGQILCKEKLIELTAL